MRAWPSERARAQASERAREFDQPAARRALLTISFPSARQFCGPRDGDAQPNTSPINVTVATAPPFCPTGWVALDESVRAPPEHAGPGGACAATPCRLPGSSPLLAGGTFLYDVVNDMTEEHDLAAEQPALVAQILARLQAINATNVPQSNSPIDPASDPSRFGGVWTPWRGDPRPEVCDPNTTAPPGAWDVRSNFDGAFFLGGAANNATLQGWAWCPQAAGGGTAPLNVSFVVDGAAWHEYVHPTPSASRRQHGRRCAQNAHGSRRAQPHRRVAPRARFARALRGLSSFSGSERPLPQRACLRLKRPSCRQAIGGPDLGGEGLNLGTRPALSLRRPHRPRPSSPPSSSSSSSAAAAPRECRAPRPPRASSA